MAVKRNLPQKKNLGKGKLNKVKPGTKKLKKTTKKDVSKKKGKRVKIVKKVPGSPTKLALAKKRVSFSSTLTHSKTIESDESVIVPAFSSTDSPSSFKGILRKKKVEKVEAQVELKEEKLDEGLVKLKKLKLEKKLHATKSSKASEKTAKVVKKSTKEIMAKMSKPERKAFIRSLAEKKKNYPVIQEAKQLWEQLRSSKCKGPEKEGLITKLMNVVSGNAISIVHNHDSSRVIQFLLSLKREDIRNELFEELTPEVIKMAKSKYAVFFVRKMLKYGSKHQRDLVINGFQGHCVSLFKIQTAAKLLNTAFNEYANAQQRFSIISEFYGNEYVLFRNEMGNINSLKEIAEKHPAKIAAIMQNLEGTLESVVVKETLKLSLTHKLLLDYLTYCTKDQRSSIIDSVKTNVPEFCHTRDGSKAALECIWHANVKERKAIVKSFKGLSVKCALDEFARRALFAIFDVVDDTVLVNKVIVKEIGDNIADVIYDKFGVWVLHYLVHPRDGRVIGKGMIEMLAPGNDTEYSLKKPTDRYTELFDCIKSPLYTFMVGNMEELITNKISSVLVLDALEPNTPACPIERKVEASQKEACFTAIAELVGREFVPNDIQGEPHIIQSGCQRFVLRKLLQLDAHQTDVKLSDFLADLPAEHLQALVGINSGCFALVDMLRSGSEKAKAAIKEAMCTNALKNSSLIGAKVLLEELTSSDK